MNNYDKENDENTYYLSKIPNVTSLHPKIDEIYKEKVTAWPVRKALESSWISDKSKIETMRYFDPDAASKMEKGVRLANITHKGIKKLGDATNRYISSTKAPNYDAEREYNFYKHSNYGGKRKKTKHLRKRRNKKFKTQKRRTR